MEIRCNVCRHKEVIPSRKVEEILRKNKGCVPCPSCGSHATTWNYQRARNVSWSKK